MAKAKTPEAVPPEKDKGPGPVKEKMDSYRKGGKVRKSGKARLHKGEVVEPPTKSKRGRKGGRE